MTWARLDDGLDEHEKVDELLESSELHGLAAIGLWVLTLAYSSRNETDGVLPARAVKRIAPKHGAKLAKRLVDAGMYDEHDERLAIHDFLDFNPSREETAISRAWDRKRKELFRDPELVAAIRSRDKDRCRYCAVLVNWRDRRGPNGGTYDHVTPRGDNTLENVVVACRRCNTRKGGRTPNEASMPLLAPGQIGASSESDPTQPESQTGSTHPTRPDPTRTPNNSSCEEREDVQKACSLLASLIHDRDPKAKVAPDGKGWQDAARLLLDRDGRPLEQVLDVIRFSQADEFWQTNVLSMPTVRKQFDKLYAKMRGAEIRAVAKAPPSSDDFLARVAS